MGLLRRIRRQKAVVWDLIGTGPTGEEVFDTPREIKVRWENKQQEFLTPAGETVVSNAVVFVGENLKLGSILWKGKLMDLPDWDNPMNNEGAFPIRGRIEIPNQRVTDYLRQAFL